MTKRLNTSFTLEPTIVDALKVNGIDFSEYVKEVSEIVLDYAQGGFVLRDYEEITKEANIKRIQVGKTKKEIRKVKKNLRFLEAGLESLQEDLDDLDKVSISIRTVASLKENRVREAKLEEGRKEEEELVRKEKGKLVAREEFVKNFVSWTDEKAHCRDATAEFSGTDVIVFEEVVLKEFCEANQSLLDDCMLDEEYLAKKGFEDKVDWLRKTSSETMVA